MNDDAVARFIDYRIWATGKPEREAKVVACGADSHRITA